MPDFIIIGGQRCGTTSLYNYLIKHPGVVSAFRKEVHFFDINYGNGNAWYRAHFPSVCTRMLTKVKERCFVTGEASPYYIFHPHAPKRIARLIPQVKLIVLLRNPVDRAYSQYYHAVKAGFETLSFEDAMEKEGERIRGETEKILENENYYSFNHQKYSYLSRGIYVNQLKTWMDLFPREQILILKSEDFYADPQMILDKAFEFLNLPRWQLKDYKKYNYLGYAKMDGAMRARLNDFFREHNQRLYEFLSVDFGWDT